eukprot:TRINITY_DN1243_c0_g1_i1.p1 TRINITY_DN1243_c0_g1~~TRINITY_DN1243_c0_g1_i1.p1  ORF type:complete len:238 (-),score=38.78 TRINITY_DN1243_c0_g1_i1:17-730(-)
MVLEKAEELGLEDLSGYNANYRNNTRCVVMSFDVAELIFKRIAPFLDDIEITKENDQKVGKEYKLDGIWSPFALNECWRICKYNSGGHFGPHYDGYFSRGNNDRSMYTFMLYLNDEYDGGTTNFLNDDQPLNQSENGLFEAQSENITHRIKATPGMALVFRHRLLHEGAQLKAGTKYIMRSEVMYKRDCEPQFHPDELRAIDFMKKAIDLETDGFCMEAVEFYKKAFSLWPDLEDYC